MNGTCRRADFTGTPTASTPARRKAPALGGAGGRRQRVFALRPRNFARNLYYRRARARLGRSPPWWLAGNDTNSGHGRSTTNRERDTQERNRYGLVIDAMDILHGKVRYDGFVLVSSDSDFTQLASRLRENGRIGIGIGNRRTPTSLRTACNRFIMIESIFAPVVSYPYAPPVYSSVEPQPLARVSFILWEASQTIAQIDGWCKLSEIKERVLEKHPLFDCRTYGASTLIDLVEKIPGIEIRRPDFNPDIRWSCNSGTSALWRFLT